MRDFEVSKERKKQYIRNWLYSLPEYRKRNWLVNCLYAASIALFVFYASVPAFVFLLGECNVAAIGAGFEVGFVVAVILLHLHGQFRLKQKGTADLLIQKEKRKA